MTNDEAHLATQVVHAGEPEERIEGAVNLPVFMSSTFEFSGENSYHDLRYIRLNNTPNHRALHTKIATLENAAAGLVTASGMAAISTTLMTVLSAGDHLLAQSCLYGGTYDFLNNTLPHLGIQTDFIDGHDPESWKSKLKKNTKAIYVETITNPLLQVAHLPEIVEFSQAHGLVSLIDNTFATPVNFRPLEIGFDVVLHSCTKYLNGHSDIVAGAVLGSQDCIDKITHRLNHFGGSLDPHACFLLHRGLKTLVLRVQCQNDNGLAMAKFLDSHPAVKKVHYPGLESHPDHRRAAELFTGFAGTLSFEPKGDATAARRFLKRIRLPIVAPSLGGVESLITRPCETSHAGLTDEQRNVLGISNGLIRVALGIEAITDLIDDFDQALG